jgi:hypothetical protein
VNRAERRAWGIGRDPWATKLYDEALMLGALGVLCEDGEVRCPVCDRVVPRSEGWVCVFACSCGEWELRDLEDV